MNVRKLGVSDWWVRHWSRGGDDRWRSIGALTGAAGGASRPFPGRPVTLPGPSGLHRLIKGIPGTRAILLMSACGVRYVRSLAFSGIAGRWVQDLALLWFLGCKISGRRQLVHFYYIIVTIGGLIDRNYSKKKIQRRWPDAACSRNNSHNDINTFKCNVVLPGI